MRSPEPQGYYAASAAPAPPRPRLDGARKADFCVVGGGYTGLSAALHLAQHGAQVVLLEAETTGFAASGRNGGQICTGLRKSQAELERWLGAAHARDLWALAEESKALVRSLAVDCDVKWGLITGAHSQAALRALAEDTEHLFRAYNYSPARMTDAHETAALVGTQIYPGARFDAGGGHLHPLKFARGLANAAEAAGAVVYEQSRVHSFEARGDGVTIDTDGGRVTAGRLLLACDAFSGELAPELAAYIGHVESFIAATAPLPADSSVIACDAAVADTRHVLDYYRKSVDNRLLFAGRESYWTVPDDVAAIVRPRMLKVFPALADVPFDYAWSGKVGITYTRMPHFGRLGERVLFAHGYSGQGVALANLGGKLLAEAATGHNERFDVFARVPATKFPGGALLRKPLISAALFAYKIADAL
jgi:gamma-glutamylputrescine oxidase